MPRIFESLVNNTQRRSQPTNTIIRPQARTLQPGDLTEIANRAQQRQQELLASSPASSGSLFPAQSVSGALPSLLPNGAESTITGAPANSPRAGDPTGVQAASVGGDSQVTVSAPIPSTGRLTDSSFDELTPTQRLDAYRTVFADDIDAVTAADGSFATTDGGSPLVAFKPRGIDEYVQIAQESVPGAAIFAEALARIGVPARPRGSTDHAVVYEGADDEVVALARKFNARVTQGEGGISVEFGPGHPLNTRFHDKPFTQGERAEAPVNDRRLSRFTNAR